MSKDEAFESIDNSILITNPPSNDYLILQRMIYNYFDTNVIVEFAIYIKTETE